MPFRVRRGGTASCRATERIGKDGHRDTPTASTAATKDEYRYKPIKTWSQT